MLSFGDLFWGIWWNPTPNAPHPVGISGPLISSDFHATETFWIGQEVNKNQGLWTQASKSPMRNYPRRTLCPKGEGLYTSSFVTFTLCWNGTFFHFDFDAYFQLGWTSTVILLLWVRPPIAQRNPRGTTRSPEDLDVAIQCGDPQ